MQSNDKVSVSIILVYIFVLKTRDVIRFVNFLGKEIEGERKGERDRGGEREIERERGGERDREREREREKKVFLCLRNESSRGEI